MQLWDGFSLVKQKSSIQNYKINYLNEMKELKEIYGWIEIFLIVEPTLTFFPFKLKKKKNKFNVLNPNL